VPKLKNFQPCADCPKPATRIYCAPDGGRIPVCQSCLDKRLAKTPVEINGVGGSVGFDSKDDFYFKAE
jgi:hypothetical protein